MAASKKPTAKQPGVFDVARPSRGHITSSGTSKPDMITHRPVIKDPMVTTVDDKAEPSAPLLKPAKKIVIKPLHDDIVPEASPAEAVTVTIKSATPAPAVATSEPTADIIPVARVSTGSPTKAPEVKDNQVSLRDEQGKPVTMLQPALAPGVPPNRDDAVPTTTTKPEQDRSARLQHIIDEEEYFLPINAVEERRSRRIALLGLLLIIVLAAAWYDTALDAGLITNTYNLPHTSLFTVK